MKRNLALLPHAAIWDAIASCHHSLGRVRSRRAVLDPAISWRLDPRDFQILRDALWVLAEMFFAAGAYKILPGVHGLPEEMKSLGEAEPLRTGSYRPSDLTCGGNHVFSTTRMHGDAARGVVDEDGRCHDLDNLYIADSGVLPRSPSVNPMLTVMAIAHRTALSVAELL